MTATMSPLESRLFATARLIARELGVCLPVKVCVIDGNPVDATHIAQMLRYSRGPGMPTYVVDVQTESDKAEAMLLKQEHDVYIIDINLDGTSGLELVASIQARGIHFPFIVLTGSEQHDRPAMSYDCMAYIHKPVTPENLRTAVDYAIKNFKTRCTKDMCMEILSAAPGKPSSAV